MKRIVFALLMVLLFAVQARAQWVVTTGTPYYYVYPSVTYYYYPAVPQYTYVWVPQTYYDYALRGWYTRWTLCYVRVN